MPIISPSGHGHFLDNTGYRCVQGGGNKGLAPADHFSENDRLPGFYQGRAGAADVLLQRQDYPFRGRYNLYGRVGRQFLALGRMNAMGESSRAGKQP